ncbi:winged helix-turn-helix domain-containing protein [Micromonospora sp. 4G57]|uniref:Winged helix-turn-helix domain-containing protein n=1 Tax=Micromonospora sicca TaxID=2202420 RepID=A0ABU5JE31_9ACTN|nr:MULTISPECIES: winged helix-turn-helix domain-containing protein [unclassified Micromonospora]MDZ5445030.1 winged helix-turn-helix domain-containing protein [Micromonospora sp. 4G57]MDZ5490850.1 winged helix-turn-helix domain-containing protein [Micromonospora sp. 4G53]
MFRGETEIDLSAREFDIPALLLTRAGQCVIRYQILDELWDGEADIRSNGSSSTPPTTCSPPAPACQLEECLPRAEYWDVPVGEQTEQTAPASVMRFVDGV